MQLQKQKPMPLVTKIDIVLIIKFNIKEKTLIRLPIIVV